MELTKNEQIVVVAASSVVATAIGAGIDYTVRIVKNRKKTSRVEEIEKRLSELEKIMAKEYPMSNKFKSAVNEMINLNKELVKIKKF